MIIQSVTKKYNDSLVLNNLSFTINQGEIVGLVGNNGAGKSTLMKVITQTIRDFDGSVEENNHVGYMIEEPKLLSNKTGLANLNYFSKIYGYSFNLGDYEDLLKSLRIYEVLHKKVKKYSLGMKQKLGIVISLLNDPRYVVLDEPTNGMDVETSLEVLQQLKKMAKKWNLGVLISSHKLEDVENACDRVLFLEKGRILEDQHLNNDNQQIVNLVFASPAEVETFVSHQNLGEIIYSEGSTVQMETATSNAEVFQFLNEMGIKLLDFHTEKQTLRKVYMNKLGGESHGIGY